MTLKNHASVRKETVKLVKATGKDSDRGEQELEFMFDSNYECMITIYISATECRNASATPLL